MQSVQRDMTHSNQSREKIREILYIKYLSFRSKSAGRIRAHHNCACEARCVIPGARARLAGERAGGRWFERSPHISTKIRTNARAARARGQGSNARRRDVTATTTTVATGRPWLPLFLIKVKSQQSKVTPKLLKMRNMIGMNTSTCGNVNDIAGGRKTGESIEAHGGTEGAVLVNVGRDDAVVFSDEVESVPSLNSESDDEESEEESEEEWESDEEEEDEGE